MTPEDKAEIQDSKEQLSMWFGLSKEESGKAINDIIEAYQKLEKGEFTAYNDKGEVVELPIRKDNK